MPEMKPVRITTSPFEMLLMVAVILSGAGSLLFGTGSRAVVQYFQDFSILWHASLILAGSLGLISAMLRFPLSLLLERVAVALLGTFMTIYAVLILIFSNFEVVTATGVLVTLAFAAACFWRTWQINRDIKIIRITMRKLAKAAQDDEETPHGD